MKITQYLFRNCLIPVIHYSGLLRFLMSWSKPKFLILNYHGVVNNLQPKISRNHLSTIQFAKHLKYFKKHFDVLPLQTLIQNYQSGSRPLKPTIAITFDDGYENNFKNAFPLLKEFQFPATIFVTAQALINNEQPLWYDALDICREDLNWTKLIGSTEIQKLNLGTQFSFDAFKNRIKHFDSNTKKEIFKILLPEITIETYKSKTDQEYWKLLNETQILEMVESGLIEIGSHGISHTNMDVLETTALNTELLESKKILGSAAGTPIESIAFPDGAYNDKVKLESKQIDYKYLLAVNYRCLSDTDDQTIFQRFSISNTTTYESIMLQIHWGFKKIGF